MARIDLIWPVGGVGGTAYRNILREGMTRREKGKGGGCYGGCQIKGVWEEWKGKERESRERV